MIEIALWTAVLFAIFVAAWFRLERRQARTEELLRSALARIYELERLHPVEPRPEPPLAAPAAVAVDQAGAERVERPYEAPPPLPPPFPYPPEEPVPPAIDWEAVIGGNWLNKLGALLIVVGIGLFLTYSLTHMGAGGKITIGMAVGISMLVAGLVLERNETYAMFSRGFIGGGWAAIYFTTYAMHAFPASRLIDDPFIATLLLLVVPIAIVVHSLVYRSEPVTILAFFITFATLNLTPLSPFTITAALLLALSLMVVAYRFSWSLLVVAGVLLTYATFALHYEPGVYGQAGLLNGQAVLWIYWILFEGYVLFEIARRAPERQWRAWLFWLNLVGFLTAASLHQWYMHNEHWAWLFGVLALAYLGSAAIRGRLAMREPHASAPDWSNRLIEDSYGPPVLAASFLAAASIVEGLQGLNIAIGLFVEAELLVLGSLLLADSMLGVLSSLVFLAASVRLGFDSKTPVRWTPLAYAMGVAGYINRALLKSGWLFPATGLFILLAATDHDLPSVAVAPAWAAALIVLALAYRQLKIANLRLQAIVLAYIVCGRVALIQLFVRSANNRASASLLALLCVFAAHYLLNGSWFIAPVATLTALYAMSEEASDVYLTIYWGVFAAALITAGFVLRDRVLRICGLLVLPLCIFRLFVFDLSRLDVVGRILSFILLGLILLGASWIYTRYREQIRRLL